MREYLTDRGNFTIISRIELMTDLTDDDDSSTFFLPEHPIILDILDENGQGSIKSWHGMDM